jgi:hypothetical protein
MLASAESIVAMAFCAPLAVVRSMLEIPAPKVASAAV